MIIQHNIMAQNSQKYYNETVQNSQKILEKLSSGYRINCAGDDVAGLAISEKMRAQITSLVSAQKNCNDAGNLLTTAEGGLQEIHTMLNRAVELATQSANGTYSDSTNRDKLQMEFDEIRTEIDRIAQGTNFNSIDLLHTKHKNDTMKMMVQYIRNFAAFKESTRTTQITGFLQKNLSKITQSTALAASKMEEIAAEFIPELSTTEMVNNVNNITPPPDINIVTYSGVPTTCGDFTVYGDVNDFDFNTTTGVLTIKGGNVTVEGTAAATTNRIEVAKDANANITLRNVNIDVSSQANTAAFKIADDSTGNVTVTLDGENTLKSGFSCAGLQKNGTTGTLEINGTGKLTATGGECGAGIGSGLNNDANNIKLTDGNVIAVGGRDGAGIGGGDRGSGNNITISGGTVTATGSGSAAGIGGGNGTLGFTGASTGHGSGNNITISGGTVTATGGVGGAGIGGGRTSIGKNITIEGGIVIAIAGSPATGFFSSCGAGIGGGLESNGSDIKITGGDVTAIGGQYGAGIGGGDRGSGNNIIIEGGIINATGGYRGAGIGGGNQSDSSGITISSGNVTAIGGQYSKAGIGGGCYGTGSNTTITGGVIDASGEENAIQGSTFGDDAKIKLYFGQGGYIEIDRDKNGNLNSATLNGKDVILTNDAKIDADVNLNIADDQKLTVGTGSTLTNDGIIDVWGDLSEKGTIINNGQIIYHNGKPDPDPTDPDKPDPDDPDKPDPDDPNKPDPDDPNKPDPDDPDKPDPNNPNSPNSSASKNGIIRFQIGERSWEKLDFYVKDMCCISLGIADLSIAKQHTAIDAIGTLKNAIDKVSTYRGYIGSLQNRVEHTINNLNVMHENITEAESRIRDANISKEMMKFVKSNILMKSGQTMLTQANQAPQGIINLLI